jgi:hypothetical protein
LEISAASNAFEPFILSAPFSDALFFSAASFSFGFGPGLFFSVLGMGGFGLAFAAGCAFSGLAFPG